MSMIVEVTADLVGVEFEGVWQCNIKTRETLAPGAANDLLLLPAASLSSAPCPVR
jgi:hypothetical protein